jgi:hypothetical protein
MNLQLEGMSQITLPVENLRQLDTRYMGQVALLKFKNSKKVGI